jgi:hypothetical protein
LGVVAVRVRGLADRAVRVVPVSASLVAVGLGAVSVGEWESHTAQVDGSERVRSLVVGLVSRWVPGVGLVRRAQVAVVLAA